jgi:MFS family permease
MISLTSVPSVSSYLTVRLPLLPQRAVGCAFPSLHGLLTAWLLPHCFLVSVGSILYGATDSSAVFMVGRFIAGFGAAGISNASITIVSICAALEKRSGTVMASIPIGFNND